MPGQAQKLVQKAPSEEEFAKRAAELVIASRSNENAKSELVGIFSSVVKSYRERSISESLIKAKMVDFSEKVSKQVYWNANKELEMLHLEPILGPVGLISSALDSALFEALHGKRMEESCEKATGTLFNNNTEIAKKKLVDLYSGMAQSLRAEGMSVKETRQKMEDLSEEVYKRIAIVVENYAELNERFGVKDAMLPNTNLMLTNLKQTLDAVNGEALGGVSDLKQTVPKKIK
jgi:hypothetical protein